MILSLVLILFVLVVAFFHYLQGFLSATISCILCAISLLVAFNYYEPAVTAMSPGKFADSAHAMMLVVLFAVTYLVLRIIFDKLIPGNVRVPAIVDKVGGGIMGLITGMLAVGLVAVAAQALPFGPSIGGYARYRVREQANVRVPTDAGERDRVIYDEFAERTFNSETENQTLILPIDDFVMGFVYHTSDGSVAGRQPFARIHPDYLQELFGQRIGIQQGAKRSAAPVAGSDTVAVQGVYYISGDLPQVDGEVSAVRNPSGGEEKLPAKFSPPASSSVIVVRIQFKTDATDDDRRTRVSTGAVRMVGRTADGKYQQWFPIGTLEAGKTLVVHKPDDFLIVPADKAADFVFEVPDQALGMSQLPGKIPDNSPLFVEAKRYGRVSLAGMEVETYKPSDDVKVLRKKLIFSQIENSDPALAARKLLGTWVGRTETGTELVLTFSGNNTWTTEAEAGGQKSTLTGTWEVISDPSPGITVVQTREGSGAKLTVNYVLPNPDTLQMTDRQSNTKTTFTRRK